MKVRIELLFVIVQVNKMSVIFILIRPTFFYCLFYGKIFKEIESGGLNKNKNKIHFLVESTIKIKIKLKKGQQFFIFRKTYF